MKAILSLFFILIFGAIALANTEANVKVDVIEMGIVLGDSTKYVDPTLQNEAGAENGIARLYRTKNARVKKALSFTTKYTITKLT